MLGNVAKFSPANTGLLDPATSDGRVIFFLPWQRMTVAGTTDARSELTFNPAPTNQDIEFILQEIRGYLSKDVTGLSFLVWHSLIYVFLFQCEEAMWCQRGQVSDAPFKGHFELLLIKFLVFRTETVGSRSEQERHQVSGQKSHYRSRSFKFGHNCRWKGTVLKYKITYIQLYTKVNILGILGEKLGRMIFCQNGETEVNLFIFEQQEF